ncbi:dnaJ homolog subfamily C member 28 isoform X1 [Rhynchophorus ferrugineus]|uniref:dnaJ homolog subfamily C member 28 isoform X1 n=2 Tax=Rhynchophorus ferrugineus TaxID=354439 RepID=UPI003FCD5A11
MALIFKNTVILSSIRRYCGTSTLNRILNDKEVKQYYDLLEIEETSSNEQIRMAYLELVKKYHPDSGTEEACVEKFQAIDFAFRTLMQQSKLKGNNTEDINSMHEDYNIKHTAPQHRQYLNYEGIGSGNPFQREKQYTQIRAAQAAENVYNHRISKVTAEENTLMTKESFKHKVQTKYGFDRLVEDLIQEAISKGEFDNLKNFGKPLPNYESRNPYVDFITHKLNEVLIDNGFTPDWILLQKEIREDILILKKNLFAERQYFGPYPLSVEENIEWSEQVYKYKDLVKKINKKIAKFNLVVPVLNKQIIPICLEREAQKAMVIGDGYEDLRNELPQKKTSSIESTITQPSNQYDTIFGILDYILKGRCNTK